MKALTKEQILSDALHIYRKLVSDDQDSVRLLTVQDLIAIAQRLEPSEVKQELLPQIRQSASDKSWRVRYMVANHFVEVCATQKHIFYALQFVLNHHVLSLAC